MDVDSRSGDSSAAGGASESHTGDNDIDIAGDTDNSSYSYVEEDSASSAASLFVSYCQSGMSAQTQGGGFAIAGSDALCDRLKMAGAMNEAYRDEMKHCVTEPIVCVGECTKQFAEVHIEKGCEETEQAAYFRKAYLENLHDAQDLVETGEFTAKIDRQTGFIFKPALLIGLLIFLI